MLVIESGGADDAPTIANPSVWFYNVGGPLDYNLPVSPSPLLNNRKFNLALGQVLGAAAVLTRLGKFNAATQALRAIGEFLMERLGSTI